MSFASKVCLRRKKNQDFSDWVIQVGPAAAKKSCFFGVGHPSWASGGKKSSLFDF